MEDLSSLDAYIKGLPLGTTQGLMNHNALAPEMPVQANWVQLVFSSRWDAPSKGFRSLMPSLLSKRAL